MVTVLMATYQGKQYLEQQLDTILAQTVPVKILISDDGSDDGTRKCWRTMPGGIRSRYFCITEQSIRAARPGTFLADAGSSEG